MRFLLLVWTAASVGSFAGCTLDRAGLVEPSGQGGQSDQGGSTPTSTVTTTTGGGDSTSTGGSPTSAGGGGQGGATSDEHCLNGIDDDDDDLIDCADDDCQPDYECVPKEPLAKGYVTPTTSSCPGDAPALTLARCGSCDCTPEAGTCTLAGNVHSNTLDCGSSSMVSVESPMPCNNGPSTERSIDVTQSGPNGDGACTAASGSVATEPSIVCEASSTGRCTNSNEVCVPATDNACILVSATSCPGNYPNERARVAPASETSCDCACSKSEVCSPELRVDSSNNCTNTTTVSLAPSGCTALGDIQSYEIPAQPSTVTCEPTATPSGGSPLELVCCTE